jgi:Icc-related predicted phosphoesterase
VIRVAAVGDVHFAADLAGTLRPELESLPERADVLLLAGDLTRGGATEEAAYLAKELAGLQLPMFAVLGNHDYHADQNDEITAVMEDAGVGVLEGAGEVFDVNGTRVGVAGAKGFGGGFPGASGSEFGEPEMKSFMRHARERAGALDGALSDIDADVKLCVLHYSPVEETLRGERLEIYPFLGCYFLAEAIDRAGVDLVVHGHAHNGSEKGTTPGGTPVRNVAQPVIEHAFNLYCVGAGSDSDC